MQVRFDAKFNILLSGVGTFGPDIAIGELVLEGKVREGAQGERLKTKW